AALRVLDERKVEVCKQIDDQGELTAKLEDDIFAVETLQEVEDLYLPYHHEQKTPADIAREKGLAPLASEILQQHELEGDQNTILEEYARPFLDPQKGVVSVSEAYVGA